MKLFGGYHIHILISPREIPAEKLRALRQGKVHLHGDPVRKDRKPDVPVDPPSLPLPLDVFPAEPVGIDFPVPGVPVEEFR